MSRRNAKQVSQSWQKLWEEWLSKTQHAEVKCTVVVYTRTTYCSQSTRNSCSLFPSPYLQNQSIFWSHAKGVRELCLINGVMNSLETEDATFSLFHALLCAFWTWHWLMTLKLLGTRGGSPWDKQNGCEHLVLNLYTQCQEGEGSE